MQVVIADYAEAIAKKIFLCMINLTGSIIRGRRSGS